MQVSEVLTDISAEFVQSPIEFTVERDFQARIVEELRAKLRNQNALEAEFTSDTIQYTGNHPNYKEVYVDHFMRKVSNNTDVFSRVHTEVVTAEDFREGGRGGT